MALFMISVLPNFRGILKLRAFKLLTLRGGALYGQHKIKTHTQLRVIGEKKHTIYCLRLWILLLQHILRYKKCTVLWIRAKPECLRTIW